MELIGKNQSYTKEINQNIPSHNSTTGMYIINCYLGRSENMELLFTMKYVLRCLTGGVNIHIKSRKYSIFLGSIGMYILVCLLLC